MNEQLWKRVPQVEVPYRPGNCYTYVANPKVFKECPFEYLMREVQSLAPYKDGVLVANWFFYVTSPINGHCLDYGKIRQQRLTSNSIEYALKEIRKSL